MDTASWTPVQLSAPEANGSARQSQVDGDVAQSVDASLSLLGWCGAVVTTVLLVCLALLSAPRWLSTALPTRACPAELSASASYNLGLLHHSVLPKLHAVPAQPLIVAVVGGSVSWGGGGGSNASYAAQFVDWLNAAYPTAHPTATPHLLVNRALPGSSSSAVTLCQEQQFSGVGHVDLLLLEYTVNDGPVPYARVPADELNIHGSANIERIIRYWQLRDTAVWLVELPGRVGQREGVRNLGSLFTAVGEYYGVPVVDASLLYSPTPFNRYWKELFTDSVHPKQQASALTTALMVRELRFHESIAQKAEGAELGRGALPNGALLIPHGPHSRSAQQAEARLPANMSDLHPSVENAEVWPWHGLDVQEAAWSSAHMLCLRYETQLRPPFIPGLSMDDYHGSCYFSQYGSSVKHRKHMRSISTAQWEYGLNPDRPFRETGYKAGFYTYAVGASLVMELGNVRRMVGLLHLDTWAPCGAAAVWLSYRAPNNSKAEQRWPPQPAVINCTSDIQASISKVSVIQHVQRLRDSLNLAANASLPMRLHVQNLPHEDERNQTRATFFILYGYVVD